MVFFIFQTGGEGAEEGDDEEEGEEEEEEEEEDDEAEAETLQYEDAEGYIEGEVPYEVGAN